jgi:LysR family glycine cleavage system transcriptional activator
MEALSAALAAARLGSFTAAAGDLDITHAAVSRRVAAAERWAGVVLFERHARGVVPTPEGQRVLARVEAALDQVALLGARAQRRHGLPTVRFACTPAFARFWLMPRLKALEGMPPVVRVDILADLRLVSLESGEAELAVRYGRGGWRGVREERLFDEQLMPAVAPALLGTNRRVAAADLLSLPLLHDGDTSNWRHWAAAHGATLRPKPSDRNLGSYALAVDGALNGLGVVLWKATLHRAAAELRVLESLAVSGPLSYFLLQRAMPSHAPAAGVAASLVRAARG